jgi:hypothetical protein
MSGMQAGSGPRGRLRWKTFAKYALAIAGVLTLLWAIWNPENRVQWVLTGVLILATWGVWLGLDHEDTEKHSAAPPTSAQPGTTTRVNPVTVHKDDRRHRRDQRQP